MRDDAPNKETMRAQLLSARSRRSSARRAEVAEAIALHATSVPSLIGARRIAAYLSMPTEPGTGPLLDMLDDRGIEVIVPVAGPDGTLDWVVLERDTPRRTTALGISEPAGTRLGAGALDSAEVVVLPALAVDHAGHRLGRGAGYYDRALAESTILRCALVHADELVPHVPHESHDVPVDLVLTEAGLFRVPEA